MKKPIKKEDLFAQMLLVASGNSQRFFCEEDDIDIKPDMGDYANTGETSKKLLTKQMKNILKLAGDVDTTVGYFKESFGTITGEQLHFYNDAKDAIEQLTNALIDFSVEIERK